MITKAYSIKDIAFQQIVIFRHHSNMTSRFESSMQKLTTKGMNLELGAPSDCENLSLSIRPQSRQMYNKHHYNKWHIRCPDTASDLQSNFVHEVSSRKI